MPAANTDYEHTRTAAATEAKRSCFDGSTLQLIGWRLLTGLITLVTLGITYPWAMCMMARWEAKHTVINGRRLCFTGKGGQLFGKYLLWCFLTVITLGIYSIWFGLGMKRWRVKHTVYADDPETTESAFTGSAGGWFGHRFLCFLVSLLTLGLAFPWMQKRLIRWETEHTEIGGSPLVFTGTGAQLLGKYLLMLLLCPLTLGIYGLFFPVSYRKWVVSHTQALSCTPYYWQQSHSHEQQAKKDYVRFHLANSETALERVKSGVTGEETEEALRAMADSGNRSAMYELFLRLKEEPGQSDAMDYLRAAALAGYHPAMLDYAKSLDSDMAALYAQLLEGSAEKGNTEAPWLLKQHYEAYAHMLHDLRSYDSAEQLQKAAYWFAIAMEHADPDALQNKAQYEKLVDKVALWMTERRDVAPKRKSGAAIFLVLVLLLGLAGGGLWCWYQWNKPVEEVPEPIPVVALWCDKVVVKEDTQLFQQVPWQPTVLSFENFEVTNTGDSPAIYQFSLKADSYGQQLIAALVTGRVSEGDMERVMVYRENFVALEDFSRTVIVQPGETLKFAVIVYWPVSETESLPEGTTVPVKITADFTEK